MLSFFAAGGWVMFVLLAVGVPMVVTAGRFAAAATPQRLALVRALTVATVFAMVAGVTSDLANAATHIAHDPDWLADPLPVVLEGFSESMAPAILGGALAAIAWILVGFGVRRLPAADAT